MLVHWIDGSIDSDAGSENGDAADCLLRWHRLDIEYRHLKLRWMKAFGIHPSEWADFYADYTHPLVHCLDLVAQAAQGPVHLATPFLSTYLSLRTLLMSPIIFSCQ
jgi:hypothetical protein